MKLYELKQVIDKCYENSGDGDVDVEITATDRYGDESWFTIESIGQFGFIRDVTIKLSQHRDGETDDDD